MTDIVIDLETLSTEPNAVVLTIGAIKFNRKEELKPLKDYDKFYIRVDPKSCEEIGCSIDSNTVNWWNKQSKEAKFEALEHPDRVPIRDALIALSRWIDGSKVIWANSPSFDCVILEHAYKKCGIGIPWRFWLSRDCRTLYDLANIRKRDLPSNIEHNSLDDSFTQLIGIYKAFRILKLYGH